jgi:hypothetical protein
VDGYAGLAGGSGLIGSIVPLSGRFDFAVADQGLDVRDADDFKLKAP